MSARRALAAAVAALLLLAGGLAAAQTGGVSATAAIGGQPVAASTSADPVLLDPSRPAQLEVVVANTGTEPVTVTRVDLTGKVLGLTFFAYQSTVNLTVAPGETGALRYPLDLSGLEGQATGLVNAQVTVDSDRGQLAQLPAVVDVRGSPASVYGLFGLALVLLTLLAAADTALAVARHQLPANRFRRGLRLLTPGVGVGLVLVFTASATRVWLASPSQWPLAAGVCAAVFFLVGYLSPTPDRGDVDGEDDDSGDDTAGIYRPWGDRFRSYESSFRQLQGHPPGGDTR